LATPVGPSVIREHIKNTTDSPSVATGGAFASWQATVDEHFALSYAVETETLRRDLRASNLELEAAALAASSAAPDSSRLHQLADLALRLENDALDVERRLNESLPASVAPVGVDHIDELVELSLRLDEDTRRLEMSIRLDEEARQLELALAAPAQSRVETLPALGEAAIEQLNALASRVEASANTLANYGPDERLFDALLSVAAGVERSVSALESGETVVVDRAALNKLELLAHRVEALTIEADTQASLAVLPVPTSLSVPTIDVSDKLLVDAEYQREVDQHLLLSYQIEASTLRRDLWAGPAHETTGAIVEAAAPPTPSLAEFDIRLRDLGVAAALSRRASPDRMDRTSLVSDDIHRPSDDSVDETVVDVPQGKVVVDSAFLHSLMRELDAYRSQAKGILTITGASAESTRDEGANQKAPEASEGRLTASKLMDYQGTVDEHFVLSFAQDLMAMSAECLAVNREMQKKRQSLIMPKAHTVGDAILTDPSCKSTLPEFVAHHISFLKSQLEKAHSLEGRLSDTEARLRARDQYLQNTIMDTARRVQELEQLTADLEAQNDELRLELRRAREDKELLAQELGDLEEDHLALQNEFVVGEVAATTATVLVNDDGAIAIIGTGPTIASGSGGSDAEQVADLMDDYVLLRDVETQTDTSGIVSLLGGNRVPAGAPAFESAADAISAINSLRRERDSGSSNVTAAAGRGKSTRDATIETASEDGESTKSIALSNRLVYATLIATTQAETISELQALLRQKDAAVDSLSARVAELELRAETVAAENAGYIRLVADLRESLAALERDRATERIRKNLEPPAAPAAAARIKSSVSTQTETATARAAQQQQAL
ncbi:hypothetical protein HK405_011679, partial [Cladochytrium tenue]